MILLDTDVILDVVLDRAPHAEASSAHFASLERHPRRCFVAWHTLSNLYYLLDRDDRRAGVDAAPEGRPSRRFLLEFTQMARVVPADADDFAWAARSGISDLEDAMQVAAARACGARWIATRNVRDYTGSPVPAVTPEELLGQL